MTSEETRLNGNLTDTASYGYDANGSLTTRSSTNGDSATYTWDLRNRLASALVTAGGQTNTSSYVYDDSGIEVRRTENGTTWLLLVDSLNPTGYAQVIEELASGLLVASYVYGLEPLSQSQSGEVSYYLLDGHSGVRQLLDAAGAVVNTYRYDAFGALLSQTGNAVNPVLYRGERFDPVLGQYYLRARFYDPARGRFIGIDPFGGNLRNPNTLNKYNYAANDPASFIDPSGWTWEWTAPNGIAAHVLFSAYALTLGKVPTFDFPVSSVSRAVLGRDVFAGDEDAGGQKPDAIDFLFKEFFELKPVTHKSKPKLLAADLDQLAKYARLLGRHGYQAGDQSEFFALAFFSVDDVLWTPIGTIIGEDGQLRTLMLESAPLSDPTRRGLMHYYTRGKPRRVKPVYAPVPQFALTDVAHCMAERNVRLYDANTRELVEQEYREEDGPRSFLPEAIAGALVLVGAGIAADRYSFQIRYFLSFIVSLLFA